MTSATPTKRGGSRPNAGAPKKGENARTSVTIRLHPATVAQLKELAAAAGTNLSRYVERLITGDYNRRLRR